MRLPRDRAVREHVPTIAVFAFTAVVAGFGVAATGTALGVWGVVALLCLLGVVLELLVLRSQVGFGPLLAADDEHLWVRAGGFLAPRVVRVAWAEVTAVTLHLWRGRRNATARYLTVDLTDDATAELTADRWLSRRARRLTSTFGAPLALAEPAKAHFLDDAVRQLRSLAPDDVRVTKKT